MLQIRASIGLDLCTKIVSDVGNVERNVGSELPSASSCDFVGGQGRHSGKFPLDPLCLQHGTSYMGDLISPRLS